MTCGTVRAILKDDQSLAERDEALDGWRGIAALIIVFCHCGSDLRHRPFVVFGFSGVHLFFVLSGYLISKPYLARLLAGQPLPSWRRYALRRITRIYPTFIVALAFYSLMRVAAHLHPPSTGSLISHALLVFNWGDRAQFFSLNAVMWSLAIEAQFYVILPLAAAIARWLARDKGERAVLMILIGLILVGLLSRGLEYSTSPPGTVRFRLPFSFLDLFAMGILVACVELKYGVRLRGQLAMRVALGVFASLSVLALNNWVLASGTFDWFTPPTIQQACLYPIGLCAAFALLLLVLRSRSRYHVPVLTSRGAIFLGEISYSVYLYHIAVEYTLLALAPKRISSWLVGHNFIYGLVALPFIVVVSYVAYRLVEAPAVSWGARWSARSQPVPVTRS